jgi:hypothetical protein
MSFETAKYERLVESILAGEVVFFVGAGFSLDSEGNTAQRLMARLLARFAALVEIVQPGNPSLTDLAQGLKRTFGLKLEDPVDARNMVTETNVRKLAERYYDINDWIISAYEGLLAALCQPPGLDEEMLRRLNSRENELLHGCPLRSKPDPVPFKPISIERLREVPLGARGKALFLETMGFLDQAIMAGDPAHCDLRKVMGDYDGLIRDRHRVLARLAREGLCPLLITTNYDLLLEGAFRLTGFDVPAFREDETEGTDEAAQGGSARPSSTYDRLYRVGAPSDFINRGAAYRSALLVKIHGCADRYRREHARAAQGSTDTTRWWHYLPSIVFTYREIQNWRKDSWSRDLVTTLLRTRTMVLCGYSGADPVVHDTFRTVYEEIRGQSDLATKSPSVPRRVRAYFTGSAAAREFHGLEILRAASRAAGSDSPPLTDHDNYLPFYYLDETKFPTLDELMVWTFHRTLRGLQTKALQADLRRTASQLLRRRTPEREIEAVRTNFRALVTAELELAATWREHNTAHWQFGRVTGWSDRFHTALLREFALAETVQRNQGPGLRLDDLRLARCYYAISDQPGWAAWGVVLEIALRRMIHASRQHKLGDWTSDQAHLEPAICEYPAVLISLSDELPSPTCVLLRFAGFERPGYRPQLRGVYKRLVIWELAAGVGLRARADDARPSGAGSAGQLLDPEQSRSPGAEDLWWWATAPVDHPWTTNDIHNATRWLGDG